MVLADDGVTGGCAVWDFSHPVLVAAQKGGIEMSSKKEYKRTKKRLKEKAEEIPGVVKMKRKKRGWGQLPFESLADQRKEKTNENENGAVFVDDLVRNDEIEFKLTNGVEVPVGLKEAIKSVKDVKVAKKVAKFAVSWHRRLMAFEEIEMVKQFSVGQDVWWTKKGVVHIGRVKRLKTRKLVVIEDGMGPHEAIVLPVRKVNAGPVPKVHLRPDHKRWQVGRVQTNLKLPADGEWVGELESSRAWLPKAA